MHWNVTKEMHKNKNPPQKVGFAFSGDLAGARTPILTTLYSRS